MAARFGCMPCMPGMPPPPLPLPNASRWSWPRKSPRVCTRSSGYVGFADAVRTVKQDLLDFLITAAREERCVAGYGAPGKGNTLLNHCGIRSDLLPFTVDLNPHKHGMFLPGTHIPVLPTAELARMQPDYVLVLPWNLRTEISAQLSLYP